MSQVRKPRPPRKPTEPKPDIRTPSGRPMPH